MRPFVPIAAAIAMFSAPPLHAESKPGAEPLRAVAETRRKVAGEAKAKRSGKRYATGQVAARILRGAHVRLREGVRRITARRTVQRRVAANGMPLFEFQ